MFPLLSFDQANPALTGARRMQDVIQSALQNAQLGTQLQYMPQQMQQQMRSQDLANQLNTVKLQYAPQMSEAELAHMGAQTRGILEGSLPYQQAHTAQIEQENKFIPLKHAMEATSKLQSGERFGPAYQLYRTVMAMPTAARAAWQAENQEMWNNTLKTLADKTLGTEEARPKVMLEKLLNKYYGELGITPEEQAKLPAAINAASPGAAQTATVTPTLQDQIAQQNQKPLPLAGTLAQPIGQLPQQGFRSDQDLTNKMRLANQMTANKALATSYSLKQAEAGVKIENWLTNNQEKYAKAMDNIMVYAGTKGKGKLAEDAMKKENPQAYQDYQWFKNTFAPSAKALITQMEGASITNQQQKIFSKMINNAVDNLTVDPASARDQINRLFETLGAISKERVNTGQPIFKGTYEKAYGYKPLEGKYIETPANKLSQYTNADWEHTAKKYGMTVAEVKKRAGVQ